MKILMVIERFHPLVGGAETQCYNLSKYFSSENNQVCVVTKRWNKSSATKERFIDGFTVYRLNPIANGRLSDYLSGFSLVSWLAVNRHKYDLVFVNGGLANIFGSTAILVSKILSKIVVAKVETPGELSFSGPKALSPVKFVHPLIKFRLSLTKKADYFVSQTKETTRQIIDFGINKDNIFHAPNTVDTDLFTPVLVGQKASLRKKLGLPFNKTIVLFVGRLVERKGLLILIESWKALIKTENNIQLVLVGSGKHQPDSVESEMKKAVESDPKKTIVLAGEKDRREVINYLRASDVFVYPSIHPEGTALSVLEAMSVGLPVITSNIDGLSDVVTSGRNGLSVEPGSISDLTSELRNILKPMSDTNITKLTKEARISVQKKYSVVTVGQKYLQFFDSIIQSRVS